LNTDNQDQSSKPRVLVVTRAFNPRAHTAPAGSPRYGHVVFNRSYNEVRLESFDAELRGDPDQLLAFGVAKEGVAGVLHRAGDEVGEEAGFGIGLVSWALLFGDLVVIGGELAEPAVKLGGAIGEQMTQTPGAAAIIFRNEPGPQGGGILLA